MQRILIMIKIGIIVDTKAIKATLVLLRITKVVRQRIDKVIIIKATLKPQQVDGRKEKAANTTDRPVEHSSTHKIPQDLLMVSSNPRVHGQILIVNLTAIINTILDPTTIIIIILDTKLLMSEKNPMDIITHPKNHNRVIKAIIIIPLTHQVK